MNKHLQLLVASTFALAAAGAYAQSSPAPESTTPKSQATTQAQPVTQAQPTTQAERDYEASKSACQTERSTKARNECLRRAEDAYKRATNTIEAPVSGNTGPSGGGASSARQRS